MRACVFVGVCVHVSVCVSQYVINGGVYTMTL